MTTDDIFALWERFERSGLATMKVSLGGDALELGRAGTAAAAPAAAAAVPAAPEAPCIRAPLVGTFYAAPAPDQPPFVKPGDRVSKGQTVCLIEAMKMMSEVAAPCDCVVEEVLAESGALLSFDAPIFRYRAV